MVLKQKLKEYILVHKQELGMEWLLKSQSSTPVTHLFLLQVGHTSSSTNWNQVFQYMSLWGIFSFKAPQGYMEICSFNFPVNLKLSQSKFI